MSQENVEMLRRIYALLDEGDDVAWDLAPPGFVLDFSRRQINDRAAAREAAGLPE